MRVSKSSVMSMVLGLGALLAVTPASAAVTNVAPGTLLFSDNFESTSSYSVSPYPDNTGDYDPTGGSPGSWTTTENPAAAIQVTNHTGGCDPGAFQGAKYLRLRRALDTNQANVRVNFSSQSTAGSHICIKQMVYVPAAEQDTPAIVQILVGNATNYIYLVANSRTDTDGSVRSWIGDISYDTGVNFTAGQWQLWQIDYTIGAPNFILTIGEQSGVADAPQLTSVDRVTTCAYYAAGNPIYLDSVSVYAYTTPSQTLFYDDHESATSVSTTTYPDNSGDYDPTGGSPGTWTITENNQNAVQVTNHTGNVDPGACQGTKCLRLRRAVYGTDQANVRANFITQSTAGDQLCISQMVYIPAAEQETAAIIEITVGNAIDLIANGGGLSTVISYTGTSHDTGIDFVAGQWQLWQIHYTVGASTCTLRIGNEYAPGVPVNVVSSVNGVTIGATYNASSPIYIDEAPMSRGRQILLGQGLQIQGYGAWNPAITQAKVDEWNAAHFSAVDFGARYDQSVPNLRAMAGGQGWGRAYGPGYSELSKYLRTEVQGGQLFSEDDFKDNFVRFQYRDEPDVTQSDILNDIIATFGEWKSLYPNALAHTDFEGFEGGASDVYNLTVFMLAAHPDMLMFNYYPDLSFGTDSRDNWHAIMRRYRAVALKGADGSGRQPIPYAQYLRLWRDTSDGPLPSESYVRMQQFVSWAYGFTFLEAWGYNIAHSTGYPAMFDSSGTPTDAYTYVANANHESSKLGPSLIRLASTDVRMIKGSPWSTTPLTAWASGAGCPRLTGIARQSGVNRDIIIGYFKPLKTSNPDYTWVNQTATTWHFMVVNGAADGTASASTATFTLTFSGIPSGKYSCLEKIDRTTGSTSTVLPSATGTTRTVNITLPGGTGELLKFYHN